MRHDAMKQKILDDMKLLIIKYNELLKDEGLHDVDRDYPYPDLTIKGILKHNEDLAEQAGNFDKVYARVMKGIERERATKEGVAEPDGILKALDRGEIIPLSNGAELYYSAQIGLYIHDLNDEVTMLEKRNITRFIKDNSQLFKGELV